MGDSSASRVREGQSSPFPSICHFPGVNMAERRTSHLQTLITLLDVTLGLMLISCVSFTPPSRGVVIDDIPLGSPAQKAGLQRGDVIHEINHQVIDSIQDYERARL